MAAFSYITYNQDLAIKYKLSIAETLILQHLINISSFTMKGGYLEINRNHILSQFPTIVKKDNSLYKILKQLDKKKIIKYAAMGGIDLIKFCES